MHTTPTALIVEDAPLLRATLAANLRQLGFEVTALEKGDEAVQVARELRPALVCLDLMLPGVGGLEVCEQLRSTDELAATPIMITSARNTPQDRMFAEIAGADDYLIKPVDPTAFAESVRRLMLRKRIEV